MAVKVHLDNLKESFFKDGLFDRLTVFLMFVVIVAGGFFIYQNGQPDPYAPLGNYPVQQVGYLGFLRDDEGKVVNPPPDQLLPTAIYEGGLDPLPVLTVETGLETLPVHAEKCLEEDVDTPVHVVGNVRWRNVDPPGVVIHGAQGTVDRQPGCQTFDYKLSLPLEMVQRLQALAAKGVRESKWQVQGDETPTSTPLAVTKYWNSTDFIIRYTGPEALQGSTTSTTTAVGVPVNPFPSS